MNTWLNGQTDFVFLIYGLAFMLLASIAQALNRQKPRALPWRWLGLFALTQSIYEWMTGLICPSFGNLCIPQACPLLFVLSLLCLLEFARSSTALLTGRAPGYWVHVLLLGCWATSFLDGPATAALAARYVLVWPGIFWAAWVLYRYHDRRQHRHPLRVAAWSLALYPIIPILFRSNPDATACTFFNPQGFLGTGGIPAYFVRTLLVVMVALNFWRHFIQSQRQASQTRKLLFLRVTTTRWLLTILALTLTCGWILTLNWGQKADDNMRSELLSRTRLLAGLVDVSRLQHLTGSPSEETNPEYEAVKRSLEKTRRADPRMRFIYLCGRRNNQIFFFMDSEPSSSQACSQPGDIYQEASPTFHEVFRSGQPAIEGPLPDRRGNWVSAFAPLTNADGHVVAVLGLDVEARYWAQEIAQHRLSALLITLVLCFLFLGAFAKEQRLQEAAVALTTSERQYHGLFEDNAAAMLLHDEQTLEILDVNAAAATFYGYSRAQMLGMSLLQLSTHSEAEVRAVITQMHQGPLTFRSRHRRSDGTLRDIEVFLSPLTAPQRPCVFAIIRDTTTQQHAEEPMALQTEQRELQQQLLQSQRMESIGRLAAGVAHDFNNQLQGILGFGDLLKRSTDKHDPRYADIEEVIKAAQQAAAISRQLLNFSRRQPADMQVLDLNKMVHDTHAIHQRLLGEDIQFEFQLDPQLDRVQANAGLMEQVLMNLLINARDAMPQGGRLTISTFNVTLEARDLGRWNDARPGRFIVLALSDTGMGVAPEHLPHIFEPFFTTKEKERGTGLGLASVYGIARQHGGWVHVYSQQGTGTTFKVYLPAVAEAQPTTTVSISAPPSAPILKGQGQRLLLVEDENGIRELAQRVLRDNNYTLAAAASVAEALRLFESALTPFDLVFSDVVLSDGNGLELVEKLLQLQPTLRVVMTSGYTGERSRWSAIQARGFRFLSKPYPVATLLRAIQETLAAPTKS